MKYVFGNWKMYLDFDESNILINGLLQEKFDSEKVGLAVFPSTLALREVTMSAKDTEFAVGAQNVAWVPKGAYTGAVSAQMFSDVGCHYALVGHSERRHVFGETNDDVRKKIEEFQLDNIELIVGDFTDTVEKFFLNYSGKIFSCNLDCDLYLGYKNTLPYIYERLIKGGYVHLDEYYSLKFPGARIACDEFFKENNIHPIKNKVELTEFERWYLTK